MSWLKSLMITSVFGLGIALVIWLVSMMVGDTNAWMAGVVALAFALVWFWVHQSMNDSELGNHTNK